LNECDSESSKIFGFPLPSSDYLPRRLSAAASGAIENLLLLRRLDTVYRQIAEKSKAKSFIDETLEKLKINYDVSEADLSLVPGTGPLLVVANHPFGGIEGLILASLLLRVRPEVKIMANYLLGRIPELVDILICVDPFGTKAAVMKNARPLREALKWLKEGHVLAVFPAGSVSYLNLRERRVIDPEWHAGIAKIVQKSQAHVLPVFFGGANSLFFQIAGMVHPNVRTVLLPRELLNKGKKIIKVRVGNVIPFRRLEAFGGDEKLIGYLRMRTYALKHRCQGAAARGRTMATANSATLEVVSKTAEPYAIVREIDNLPGSSSWSRMGLPFSTRRRTRYRTSFSRSDASGKSHSGRPARVRAERSISAISTSITRTFFFGTREEKSSSGPTVWGRST